MSKHQSKIPTDFELLTFIYNHYYDDYISFIEKSDQCRDSKIYVPIDCELIAKYFSVDRDIIFGRLYYHLENKYGYQRDSNNRVYFYCLSVGKDIKCINFPYMSSVLADLSDKQSKYITTIKVSLLALFISLAATSFTVYDHFSNKAPVTISNVK
ncbi:hypothetical protein ABFV74_15605 [Pseudoalteromonas distincta]|uniref:hypothetical protein n=1 Tax=Pseudoalteromonas distincta TaxID=77608 RepID=UPI00321838FA